MALKVLNPCFLIRWLKNFVGYFIELWWLNSTYDFRRGNFVYHNWNKHQFIVLEFISGSYWISVCLSVLLSFCNVIIYSILSLSPRPIRANKRVNNKTIPLQIYVTFIFVLNKSFFGWGFFPGAKCGDTSP